MDSNTDISQRIEEMINFLGITGNKLGSDLGYKRSQSIYDILKGKSKPSFDFFYKILMSEYSDRVNIEYLITGEGSIEKKKVDKESINSKNNNYSDVFSEAFKEIINNSLSNVLEDKLTPMIEKIKEISNRITIKEESYELLESIIGHNILEGNLSVDLSDKEDSKEDSKEDDSTKKETIDD